jgi:hypothetical protein
VRRAACGVRQSANDSRNPANRILSQRRGGAAKSWNERLRNSDKQIFLFSALRRRAAARVIPVPFLMSFAAVEFCKIEK